MRNLRILSLFLQLLFFSSCVSFSFDSLKDQRAKGVTFKAPSELYKKAVKEGMDAAWVHSKNNNTLSFFSNCSSATRFIALKHFQEDLVSDLKGFQILNQEETTHQGQKARRLKLSKVHSSKEKTNIDIFLFKKKNCFYVISFLVLSAEDSDSGEIKIFEDFISEFQAP